MTRARKKPIPITLVCGPRGAGKTTLINRLLGMPAFADTAVILNDFGEVALKNALVEKAEDGFIALGSGCICCSVRGALADGLEKLIRDLDNGRVTAIARVIIEADAAADPAAILAAVARHPYLSLRFVADGIVALLDTVTAAEALATRADAVRQVAMADVVALSGSAMARAALASLNPTAKIVDAAQATARDIVGHSPFDPATGDIDAWIGDVPEAKTDGSTGEAGRIHVFTVERRRSIPTAALDRFLDYLSALQGPNLIRVRGAVATGEGETVVVDGLGSFFHPPLIVDTARTSTRFSVIARDLDQARFEGYLDAFLNEARIDTPDRDALVANPLAIAGFSARSGGRSGR